MSGSNVCDNTSSHFDEIFFTKILRSFFYLIQMDKLIILPLPPI